MKLAILGGSFNPVHIGHLFIADTVLSRLHYDRVVLVPAFRSPFKLGAVGMEGSAHDRLEMIAASITGDPRLTVDDCELRREGVSYTADTLEDIIARYLPDGKPGLIIGDDLAEEFPRWHRAGDILSMADIIIARRVRVNDPVVSYTCTYIANDIMEISSELTRERIKANGAWRYLVPPAARTIIEDRGLYGAVSPIDKAGYVCEKTDKSLIFRIEETAREMLSLYRFLHSRNTALFAWDMCRRLNNGADLSLDPELGYLAGIAHDLGKELGDNEQLRLAKSDGKKITQMEKDKPTLLHGRVSAVLLRERFNVQNNDVLEAVASHTYGGGNMCPLAKIIYIADKIEVSRYKYDQSLRNLAFTGNNLDKIFLAVLDQTVSSLRSRKLKLSSETLRLLDSMKGLQK